MTKREKKVVLKNSIQGVSLKKKILGRRWDRGKRSGNLNRKPATWRRLSV